MFITMQKCTLTEKNWQLTKALESWSWRGCAGEPAVVEVYARAAKVEILINGKSAGCRKLKDTCRAVFQTTYEDGEITAVSYDGNGYEIGRRSLKTAGNDTILQIRPEKRTVKQDRLAYIWFRYTDLNGIWKPMEKHTLKVTVENGTLAGLGSASPYKKGNYTQNTVKTYYGEALGVVRADGSGPVKITVCDETHTYKAELPCE